MSTQRYIYWHPDEPLLEKTPENCEVLDAAAWLPNTTAPTSWEFPRRWPVTEAEWRTHHYCQAYGITVPEGWRVVDFRVPRKDQRYLRPDASIGDSFTSYFMYPILERIEEWITPTDEDAKRRPAVQVRGAGVFDEWRESVLIAVVSKQFWVILDGRIVCSNLCRMKKENNA